MSGQPVRKISLTLGDYAARDFGSSLHLHTRMLAKDARERCLRTLTLFISPLKQRVVSGARAAG